MAINDAITGIFDFFKVFWHGLITFWKIPANWWASLPAYMHWTVGIILFVIAASFIIWAYINHEEWKGAVY